MRLTHWTLFITALAGSVSRTDASASVNDDTCVDKSAVTALETKINDLQHLNNALQRESDSQSAEKLQLLTEAATKHDGNVLQLNNEIAMLKKDVEKLENDLSFEKTTVEKVKAELTTVRAKLNEETTRAYYLESKITKLEGNLAKERVTVSNTDAQLKAALAKLSEETKRTEKLKKDQQVVEKKNQALMQQLGKSTSGEHVMAALLSSYYDEALKLAEKVVGFAQEKMKKQSSTLEQVQSKVGDLKKVVYDSTDKFYQKNLAATLSPILANVRKTVDPMLANVYIVVNSHVEQYLPTVQIQAVKAKEKAVYYAQKALRRAKLARLEAIALLEQNEHVAAHAQKLIDGVLLILAAPLVLFQIRLVLSLVWWLLTTTLCVLTCGLCCGPRQRNIKAKRRVVKKTASVHASLSAPVNGPVKKTTTSKTALTAEKRTKKGKN